VKLLIASVFYLDWKASFTWWNCYRQGCSAEKRCGNAPEKRAFLKQPQTHFKAKHSIPTRSRLTTPLVTGIVMQILKAIKIRKCCKLIVY